MIDVGGYYYIRNPGWQILFAYGHTAFGQTENYAYLGLYHTWGSDKKKGASGSGLRQSSPSDRKQSQVNGYWLF